MKWSLNEFKREYNDAKINVKDQKSERIQTVKVVNGKPSQHIIIPSIGVTECSCSQCSVQIKSANSNVEGKVMGKRTVRTKENGYIRNHKEDKLLKYRKRQGRSLSIL